MTDCAAVGVAVAPALKSVDCRCCILSRVLSNPRNESRTALALGQHHAMCAYQGLTVPRFPQSCGELCPVPSPTWRSTIGCRCSCYHAVCPNTRAPGALGPKFRRRSPFGRRSSPYLHTVASLCSRVAASIAAAGRIEALCCGLCSVRRPIVTPYTLVAVTALASFQSVLAARKGDSGRILDHSGHI